MKTRKLLETVKNLIAFLQLNRLVRKATEDKYEKWQRVKAIAKLGKLGRQTVFKPGNREIEKTLLQVMSGEPEIRIMAADALAEFGETQWKVIIKGNTDDFERLAQMDDERVNNILINALSDFKDNEKQMAAAIAMGMRGSPEFAEPLLSQFSKYGLYLERNLYPVHSSSPHLVKILNQDGDVYSQMSLGELAAISLSKLDSFHFKHKNRVVFYLKKYLIEYRPETRKAIAITLSKLGDEKWLNIIQGDSHDYDRIARSGDPDTVKILTRAIGFSDWKYKPDNTTVGTTRKRTNEDAARALGLIDNPGLLDSLEKAQQNELTDVREAVCKALGNVRNTRSLELLMKSLNDRMKSVREEAAKALISVASDNFSIVAGHWEMISRHIRQSHHDREDGASEWSCEFHSDDIKHTDSGIGLEIPPELKA